jgi:hypothetical protein
VERNRRLSLCACAHTAPDTVSGGEHIVQGCSCTRCRRTGPRRGWRWELRFGRCRIGAASSVRRAEIPCAGCGKVSCSASAAGYYTTKAPGGRHPAKAVHHSANRTRGPNLRDSGCRNRCGNRRRRNRGSRAGLRRRNRLRDRHGHWQLDRSRDGWRCGDKSSSNSDSILPPAAPRTPITQGLPPYRLVRCRRKRRCEAVELQSLS